MKDIRLYDNDPAGGERSFNTGLPSGILAPMQQGVMKSLYRGVPFLKSPFDIGIYMQLMCRLRPSTVIEIGSKSGGSALWFADLISAQTPGNCRVVAIDINPQQKFEDDRITFLTGNAGSLRDTLSDDAMAEFRHPLLVVEDSSHRYEDSIAVLDFFDPYLEPGDYIVIEDGIVNSMEDPAYAAYENGPNRAVYDFLSRRGSDYIVDTGLCDHYGFNATYNPNGWLRRL